VISFVHGSAQEKKACGELFDREAVRWVRTACVDTSYLAEGEALEIKQFVAKESRPGHLLRRMPWELTDQCAAADAVIRAYFAQTVLLNLSPDVGSCSDLDLYRRLTCSSFSEQGIQVVLLVYDRASVRRLYRTEGRYKGTNRTALLKGLFSKLVKDLRSVQ
jgi:hypothetical protein